MTPFTSSRGRAILMLTTIFTIISFNVLPKISVGQSLTDGTIVSPGDNSTSDISPDIKSLLNFYDKQVYFTENKGQWPANVIFKADFPYGQAIATSKGMIVGTFDPSSIYARFERGIREEEAKKNHLPFNEPKVHVKGQGWMMSFLNSSSSMTIESKAAHKDVFNYFSGKSSNNVLGATNYQEVWYRNVYDHVDVRYYPSQEGTLEYDMVCQPGFDKDKIAIKMDGVKNVYLKKDGSLVLATSVGNMILPAPVAYQKIGDNKMPVTAHYVISDKNVIGFSLGDYDPARTVIIDPIGLIQIPQVKIMVMVFGLTRLMVPSML